METFEVAKVSVNFFYFIPKKTAAVYTAAIIFLFDFNY